MERSSEGPGGGFVGGARGELSARAVRALWWGSAGLVLGVLGTSVVVAGTEHGGRLPVAVALVLAQVCALRWLVRAPVAVLAATAPTGLAVWALLPAVTLTGALLAAQIALCVLSAVMPRRVSLGALAAMCLPAPLAFGAGGPAGLAVFVLTVVLAWTAGQWRRAQRARTRAETRRAVLEERARIAREVHDVVAHTLSVVVVQAGAAEDVFSERPDQARQALRAIETGARSALGELRLLLRAFGPEAEAPEDAGGDAGGDWGGDAGGDWGGDWDWDGGGGRDWQRTPSLARLDELADAVRAAGLAVHVSREGPLDGLPAAVDLAAYRIVQEALTNALRHAAGADEVRVRVVADGAGVRLTVVDNGRARRRGSADHARPEAPAGRTSTAGPDGPTSPRDPDGPGSADGSDEVGSAGDFNGPGSPAGSGGPGSARGSGGRGSVGGSFGPGSPRGSGGPGSVGGSGGPGSPRGSGGVGSVGGSGGVGSVGGSGGVGSVGGSFRPGPVGVGRGVVGMRERARLVGGSLRAGPLPGGGFEVTARLPVEDVS